MSKAKTTIIAHDGRKIKGHGEMVMAVQGNRIGQEINVNIDWSFDTSLTPIEIKSMIGGFLGNLEDAFGEKFVTQAIAHWGYERGKLVETENGKVAYFRGRGWDVTKDIPKTKDGK